ncbi:N-6 DNA methylase [Mailhella sp.]
MLGAIVGDIAGSRFEWANIKTKDFDLMTRDCRPTDDSVMTLAIAQAVLDTHADVTLLPAKAVASMQAWGRSYPDAGYGGHFSRWITSDTPQPYNSFGNGAAMRVSACGFAATSLEEAIALAHAVTAVTHDHPEGLKGAEAVAVAIWLARRGKSLIEIRDHIHEHYYPMDFTLNGIRPAYRFDVSCHGSVPQAIMAFLEAENFEDAIRNAISIGGDSDTIAAIAGSIAEAYFGIPADIRKLALTYLDARMLKILTDFEAQYPPVLEKKSGDFSVAVSRKRKASSPRKAQTREQLMLAAVEEVDADVKAAEVSFEETSAQRLFAHLFEACNILRGPINQDEFKTYVTPILFLKRISDVYDEETAEAVAQYGDGVEDFEEDELHLFLIPDGCHWQDIRSCPENVGTAIVNAMVGIERANPDTLSGLFSSFDDANWTDKNKLSDDRLKDLIEHMSSLKVGNRNYSADVMGDAYEFLIKKFADLSKKNAGEFYTPRSVVKLMVMLLAPQPKDTVYDPACGTGGMLIEAIRAMKNEKASYGKIFGQEKNLATSAIARMNLFLHGAREFSIKQDDTLRNPQFLQGGKLRTFDCVLANPPFGMKKWGAEAFASDPYGRKIWGCPSDSSADFAWLQHMICSMDEKKGRLAVVLPQGVLFHSGKEGEIRKQLVESDKLEAVITLVGGLFYSTGVSACILFLNNAKPAAHRGKVCMIDASGIYTPLRAQNVMTEENIQTVYDLFAAYEDVIERCRIVSKEDILAQGGSLAVNTYIEKKPAEAIDPAKVKREFLQLVAEIEKDEEELKALLKEGGYLDE